VTALIGVLGGGQLGRMMAQSAADLDLAFRFLDPSPEACAAPLGEHIRAGYDDPDAVARFIEGLGAATYEFENIPAETTRAVAAKVPLRPSAKSIELTQDRLVEKNFIADTGASPAPFRNVESEADLDSALAELGRPAVLKTRRFGYDGKGQTLIKEDSPLDDARALARSAPCVLEGFIDFTRELSVVVVRTTAGETITYPVTENTHAAGILRVSTAPAAGRTDDAARIATDIAAALDHVGALCVELFDTPAGLLVNEIAPRVHNSGHWTIDATNASQFENHVRAVADLPLAGHAQTAPALMLNLIGDLPGADAVRALDPAAHYHDYAKAPRPGRKVGHITLVGNDLADRAERLADLPGVDPESARSAARRLRVS